jgi:hypothetical protein
MALSLYTLKKTRVPEIELKGLKYLIADVVGSYYADDIAANNRQIVWVIM